MHCHQLQLIHHITVHILLYMVLPACNIFFVKKWFVMHTKYSQNHCIKMDTAGSTSQWVNSTIHPLTSTAYNMKIQVWPTVLKFFDFLSQKLIWTTQQNSHQTCKEAETSPFATPKTCLYPIRTVVVMC